MKRLPDIHRFYELSKSCNFIIFTLQLKKILIPMDTPTKEIKWFGMKLTHAQKNKIQRLADRAWVSQKKAVMDLVEKGIKEDEQRVRWVPGSFYARIKELVGGADGRRYASSNPAYTEGYGE